MPALAFGVIYSVFKELPLEGRTGPRNWRTSFLELTPTRLPCPATTGGEQVLRASVSNACLRPGRTAMIRAAERHVNAKRCFRMPIFSALRASVRAVSQDAD